MARLDRQSHDYKRHGTTTLFAALEIGTGKIIATHSKRRRRVEFLDFMDSITAVFPGRQLPTPMWNFISRPQARRGSIRSRYGSRPCRVVPQRRVLHKP